MTSDKTQLLAAQGTFDPLENLAEKMMPEGKIPLALDPGRFLFRLLPDLLFFVRLPVAKVDFAGAVLADFHQAAFIHSIGVNGGLQMVAEFVLGQAVLALTTLAGDDLHIFRSGESGCFGSHTVAVRNLDEIRHLGKPSGNVRVELAIEASCIGTAIGILPHLRE